ncbi:MAG TPA: hypothetical protein VFM86_07365, partial [Pedococcus sp.]|nr:hypothetical protein [Pedococcus sp.]
MTAMVLMVRAAPADLERRAVWALSTVRIAPADAPGWTLVDVGSHDQAALERVAEEVTKVGPGLLLVVGEWRSALQLWARGRRRATVGWTAGRVNGLDAEASRSTAAELERWLGVDPQPLVLVLRSPASPEDGWQSLATVLGLPVPPGFPYRGAGELDSDRARVLERRTLLEAAADDHGSGQLPSAPDRTPEPAWRLAGRVLLVLVFVSGIAWTLSRDDPRYVTVVALALGTVASVPEV